ncbi:radical SAM protein, BA_1875 family [Streptoalloteichus tenebrarius]|uniref:Radical SAM protein, BA_1875 family n=1 Tax=Streptoalloteichus tenebrarius (strain ATCC 17920 / DSM 40477 / JCM 4838 / CBS 697.72 / NBRC 16177 / NCIMB 11028 / NRRL B-12390 / A12253. 1 / ISP 5477) TaxID=1933 RepID=A0ABT1HZJ0_STRSD|nr:TIGR04053 family radical SAM/SPASM domain-containing protein [Streptoalloteichus tenebrarius]MCP2260954.1 radical SAM protein, BA_1875 family [Streptoalloteichus tenebrarius]BFE98890.1 TIGR04053 family radical SAM/SPASM domain-containing protein [Streptoalloteichus tenebrarius]
MSHAVRRFRHDVADRPFLVIWEAPRACPLVCRHCRATAVAHRDPAELDTAAAVELMRQVATFGRPAPLFVITGGDPFQRPDLTTLVRRGTELGLRVAVSPSGTPTLTRDNLAAVHEAGATAVSLSLDGATRASHDGFRGVPGVFDLTLDAWRACQELGLKVQINTSVTATNLTELADLAALVHARGAQLWSLFVLVPTGRGRAMARLSAPEVEDVLHFAHDVGALLPTKTTEAPHFRRVAIQRAAMAEGRDPEVDLGLGPLYRLLRDRMETLGLTASRRVRRPPLDVNAGRGFVFVSHTGEVHPSGFLPLSAGNVRQRALPDIYRYSPLFQRLRDPDALTGRCGRCEFRTLCGGSRSRAYALTGDPLAEEPWCVYRPGGFRRPVGSTVTP